MNSKLFLVDVDGTLFNTQKLRETNRQRFAEQFGENKAPRLWEIFDKVREEKGFPDIKEIAAKAAFELKLKNAKSIENFFIESDFKNYLFPGALALLKRLEKEGKVLIYSQGDMFFQLIKIKKSGIEEVVGAENVIIREDKTKYLPQLKLDLQKEKFDEIVIIDNLPSFLESAGRVFPQAKLVLAQEGKYNT